MPKSQVTEKMVSDLCDEIYVTNGRDPTYSELTSALNCSNSTLAPYYQSWQSRRRPERHPLPQVLADKASTLAQLIWGLAVRAARQVAQEGVRACDEALEAARQQREIAMQEISKLEEDRARMAAEIETLVNERAELRVRLDALGCLKSRLEAQDELLAAIAKERDQALGKVSALEGQLSQLLKLLESLKWTGSAEQRRGRTNGAGGSDGAGRDA